jgi:hypothetical protein
MNRLVLLALALVLFLAGWGKAQTNANFSGTWTLSKTEPPLSGSGIGGGGDPAFGAIAQTVVIAQTSSNLTFESGPMKAVYALDGTTTVTPPGDVNGLKTRAHWDGSKLHLHYKRGQNWGRDVLAVSGNALTVLRDVESGGASTTRTITYTK